METFKNEYSTDSNTFLIGHMIIVDDYTKRLKLIVQFILPIQTAKEKKVNLMSS